METLELPSIEKVKRKEKILRMVDIYIYIYKNMHEYNIIKSLLEMLSDRLHLKVQ